MNSGRRERPSSGEGATHERRAKQAQGAKEARTYSALV
jgi:hypothetical protein